MMRSIQFDITIQAEKDAELWVIPAETYRQVMEESAPLSNFTNEVMAARFSDVMWLIEQVLWKSFDRRLAAFLLEESAIEGTRTLKTPMSSSAIIWAIPARSSRACCVTFRERAWCGSPGARWRSWMRTRCGAWRNSLMPCTVFVQGV